MAGEHSEQSNDTTVDLKTGPFGLKLSGANAIVIFLFITLLADIGLNLWQSAFREHEHRSLECMIRLNLFIYTLPRNESVDWNKMPVDLYPCIPRFIYERPVPQR